MDDLISRKRALEEMTFSCGIEQDCILYVPLRDVNNHLKNLPSEAYLQTIATERYEDLCEYFGNQENPILTDRREFKRWLDRVKWHVKKVDELARRSEDEWCTDCPAYDHEKHYCPRFRRVIRRTVQEIEEERKRGRWIPVDSFSAFGGDEELWMAHGNPVAFYYCSNCKEQAYAGEDGQSLITDFCPNCGADMRGEQDEQQE